MSKIKERIEELRRSGLNVEQGKLGEVRQGERRGENKNPNYSNILRTRSDSVSSTEEERISIPTDEELLAKKAENQRAASLAEEKRLEQEKLRQKKLAEERVREENIRKEMEAEEARQREVVRQQKLLDAERELVRREEETKGKLKHVYKFAADLATQKEQEKLEAARKRIEAEQEILRQKELEAEERARELARQQEQERIRQEKILAEQRQREVEDREEQLRQQKNAEAKVAEEIRRFEEGKRIESAKKQEEEILRKRSNSTDSVSTSISTASLDSKNSVLTKDLNSQSKRPQSAPANGRKVPNLSVQDLNLLNQKADNYLRSTSARGRLEQEKETAKPLERPSTSTRLSGATHAVTAQKVPTFVTLISDYLGTPCVLRGEERKENGYRKTYRIDRLNDEVAEALKDLCASSKGKMTCRENSSREGGMVLSVDEKFGPKALTKLLEAVQEKSAKKTSRPNTARGGGR